MDRYMYMHIYKYRWIDRQIDNLDLVFMKKKREKNVIDPIYGFP